MTPFGYMLLRAGRGARSCDDGDGEERRNGLVNVGHHRSADSRQATLDHRRAYAPAGLRRGRHWTTYRERAIIKSRIAAATSRHRHRAGRWPPPPNIMMILLYIIIIIISLVVWWIILFYARASWALELLSRARVIVIVYYHIIVRLHCTILS